MSDSAIKPRVLTLLSYARERERNLAASLTDAERERRSAPEQWAPRDRFVSIMRWRELQTGKLDQAVRGETPPEWRDGALVATINTAAFERYRDAPFAEIERASEVAYQALVAQVERMSEAELADPERYTWADGAGLWQETLGNGFWYPFTQMVALALDRGDRDGADALQSAMLDATRATGLSETLGVTLYNAACFYATNNWPEKALALLSEAFRARPTLVEWSRHDSDLDRLRADPRFQAIYEDPALIAAAPVSQLIAPDALAAAMSGASAPLVIDVRGPSEYAAGHVRGAVNIPLGKLPGRLRGMPVDQRFVTYCNMNHRGESRGERAAALLRERGYQARTLDGGFPAWQSEGLPVE